MPDYQNLLVVDLCENDDGTWTVYRFSTRLGDAVSTQVYLSADDATEAYLSDEISWKA